MKPPMKIAAGEIYWLPRREDLDQSVLSGLVIEDGCYDHPVIIIDIEDDGRKAQICIVSQPQCDSILQL